MSKKLELLIMTEVDTTEITDAEKPPVQRSKAMITFSKILLFLWGLIIGVTILNPFEFELTFYHFVALALVTFFIIIFYNGMTAKEKPDTVKVKNFVQMK